MEIRGLERHAKLQQYVNDIELRLAEYEQGKCSFEKVAINFRWCVEYILREYQKEHPACAAEDSFGTIKNLQDLCIIDRSGADALHQARKIGNKGGAHLTDETTAAKDVRAVFSLLTDFLPVFLERFPEPSQKALPNHQAVKIVERSQAEYTISTGNKYSIELMEPTFMGFVICDEISTEPIIMSDGAYYYNVPGITKAARSMVDTMKMRKMDNTGFDVPGVAQTSLGYCAIAYSAEPDGNGYGNRKKRYWSYGRPNKLDYFFDLARFVHTLTLPSCFAEDAFDCLDHPQGADESYYMTVRKRSWSDVVKYESSIAAVEAYENHYKFSQVTKLVLPENLQPGALSWLNLFIRLEELVLPSTMYMEDGVIYSKAGNQILALLRNRVDRAKVNEFLLDNPHTYVYPGADWGSGYEIRSRVDGRGRYLETEEVIRARYLQELAEAEREERRQEQALRQRIREQQKAKQAAQAQQAAQPRQGQAAGGTRQQQRTGAAQTGPANGAKKLCKSGTDRWITGVCGGIANYFGLPSALVRLVFGALGMSGLGFWAYVLLALFLPKESDT